MQNKILSFSSESDYLNYLSNLSNEQLKNEYALCQILNQKIKIATNAICKYFHLEFQLPLLNALKSSGIQNYKAYLHRELMRLQLVVKKINSFIKKLEEIEFVEQGVLSKVDKNVTASDVFSLYLQIVNEEDNGCFDKLNCIVNSLFNKISVIYYHCYNKDISIAQNFNQSELLKKILCAFNQDGSCDYKSTLEKLEMNIINTFEVFLNAPIEKCYDDEELFTTYFIYVYLNSGSKESYPIKIYEVDSSCSNTKKFNGFCRKIIKEFKKDNDKKIIEAFEILPANVHFKAELQKCVYSTPDLDDEPVSAVTLLSYSKIIYSQKFFTLKELIEKQFDCVFPLGKNCEVLNNAVLNGVFKILNEHKSELSKEGAEFFTSLKKYPKQHFGEEYLRFFNNEKFKLYFYRYFMEESVKYFANAQPYKREIRVKYNKLTNEENYPLTCIEYRVTPRLTTYTFKGCETIVHKVVENNERYFSESLDLLFSHCSDLIYQTENSPAGIGVADYIYTFKFGKYKLTFKTCEGGFDGFCLLRKDFVDLLSEDIKDKISWFSN